MLTMFSEKIMTLPPGVNAPPSLRARGASVNEVPAARTYTEDLREERRHVHHEADVVIVGAGIVGCAAAVAFGKQGRSVILLERSLKEPDRIVGELLQPGGVNALEKLGLKGTLVAGWSMMQHVLTVGDRLSRGHRCHSLLRLPGLIPHGARTCSLPRQPHHREAIEEARGPLLPPRQIHLEAARRRSSRAQRHRRRKHRH